MKKCVLVLTGHVPSFLALGEIVLPSSSFALPSNAPLILFKSIVGLTSWLHCATLPFSWCAKISRNSLFLEKLGLNDTAKPTPPCATTSITPQLKVFAWFLTEHALGITTSYTGRTTTPCTGKGSSGIYFLKHMKNGIWYLRSAIRIIKK